MHQIYLVTVRLSIINFLWLSIWNVFSAEPTAGKTDTNDSVLQETFTFDPLADSTADEVQLYSKLAERSEKIRMREEKLQKQTLMLKAAQKTLDEKIKQFDLLKKDLEELLKRLDEKQNKDLLHLVQMYKDMKPKQAGPIFEKLETPIAIAILKEMDEKKAAKILAAIKPEISKTLTEELIKKAHQFN